MIAYICSWVSLGSPNSAFALSTLELALLV